MTKSAGEWLKLGYDENGFYKNPSTGKYTMGPNYPKGSKEMLRGQPATSVPR